MNRRQFSKYLARDLHCFCGCLGREETYVPNHRASRGMGGSKLLDRPSNVMVMCSGLNILIEQNADLAAQAKQFGWKLERWQVPEEVPIFDRATGEWWLLDNEYNRAKYERKAA